MRDDETLEADRPRDADEADHHAAVEAVVAALDAGDADAARAVAADLHEADLADVIEQLTRGQRVAFVRALGPAMPPEALAELEESTRDEVLRLLDPAVLAEAVRELDSDDVVYLIEDLEDEDQKRVLEALDAEDRFVISQALGYPEYSAGRLMQREVVTAPPWWTVGQMIDFMRASDDLPEPFYDVIVVDPAMKPLGMIPLSRLLGARRPMTLEGVMETEFRTVRVADEQEDVARLFNKYHLVTAPVLDETGRLAGVITIDDAMAALDEETEEDMLRLAGVGDEA
ncbi:MAG: magnesium transporter, partial [Rhodobacteraceae bacterium]